MIQVVDFLPTGEDADRARSAALTRSIATMEGSRILASAGDARALRARGVDVCDLTVGDYSPEQFRAPEAFLSALTEEITAGRNQYPPSDGIPELQKAVVEFYAREMGVQFPDRSVVICGGARPPIYAVFRSLVEAGERVVFPVPSWNNDYYTHLCGAKAVPLRTRVEQGFTPTPEAIEEVIGDPTVRMICLNTPLNPCGTVISAESLASICRIVVRENRVRAQLGYRPVFLLFDQVYWPLTFGSVTHHHPLALVPEIAPHVIYVDAISKWLVGTGLRLGWAVVPPYLYEPIRDFMGHVGGWAPRPVQAAAARWLLDPDEFKAFRDRLREQLQGRLTRVHQAFADMKAAGLPVESAVPQGAIYTSVRFDVIGRRAPSGQVLRTNDEVRRYLLNEARVALVAFQAFGLCEDTGWFRVSVGAVGTDALDAALIRLREAVAALA